MVETRSSDQARPGTALYTLLPSLIAIVLVAAAFAITAGRSLSLEMQTQPSMWVINAIPAALSELHFGHTRRYTILRAVNDRYYGSLTERNVLPSAKSINLSMRKVRELNRAGLDTSYVLMGPDDKGIVDLIELSFLTFGYAAENVTLMYYVILAASCSIYVAAFWRTPSRLLLVAALLAMLYLSLPMVAYNGQLRSVLALRALPVLAMVACLHCLVFMAGSLRNRASPWQIGFVAIQIGLISFTVHLRTTTIWQVMTIIGFGVVLLFAARFRRFGIKTVDWRSAGLAVGVTVGLTISGYLGVQAYQKYGLPEEYRRGDEITTRVFWHNIYSGLAFHPDFAERYRLRIDDSSVFAATGEFLSETGRRDIWLEMLGPGPGFETLKFAKYDPFVREMLVARCWTYLRECVETMVYFKPVAFVENLAWLYGLRSLPPNLEIVVPWGRGEVSAQVKHQYLEATELMDQRGQRAYLWTPLVLLIVMPFALLLASESRPAIWTAFAALVALTAGSMIPTVIGYPVPHTILEGALTIGALGYVGLCVAAATWLPALRARGLPRRAEASTSSPLQTAAR